MDRTEEQVKHESLKKAIQIIIAMFCYRSGQLVFEITCNCLLGTAFGNQREYFCQSTVFCDKQDINEVGKIDF